MRLSEKKAVEDPVLRQCKKRWPLMECKKMNGMGQRSWPDRMFCIPGGQPFLIEFKTPGEKPTKLQQETIDKLRRQGYDVEVHDNPKKALEAIEQRIRAVDGGEAACRLDPAQLSEEGDQVRSGAHGRGAVPRSRPRKN